MRLFRRVPDQPSDTLAYLIVKLDGLRAFRRADPERLKPWCDRADTTLYDEVRGDLTAIAFAPFENPRLRPWIQTAATFRSLLPIAVFSIVLLTLLQTGLFTVRNSAIPIVFVVASMVVLLGLVVSDLGARMGISAFERENPELNRDERDRIRGVIDRLFVKYARALKRENRDPAELLLYHADYKNGENGGTVRKRVLGVFPARYEMYRVKPARTA